jgi:hypothetical protein
MTELPPLSLKVQTLIEQESASYDVLIREDERDRLHHALLQTMRTKGPEAAQVSERRARIATPWYFTWKLAAALLVLGALCALLLLLRKPAEITADVADAQAPRVGSVDQTSVPITRTTATPVTSVIATSTSRPRPRPPVSATAHPIAPSTAMPLGTSVSTGQR